MAKAIARTPPPAFLFPNQRFQRPIQRTRRRHCFAPVSGGGGDLGGGRVPVKRHFVSSQKKMKSVACGGPDRACDSVAGLVRPGVAKPDMLRRQGRSPVEWRRPKPCDERPGAPARPSPPRPRPPSGRGGCRSCLCPSGFSGHALGGLPQTAANLCVPPPPSEPSAARWRSSGPGAGPSSGPRRRARPGDGSIRPVRGQTSGHGRFERQRIRTCGLSTLQAPFQRTHGRRRPATQGGSRSRWNPC